MPPAVPTLGVRRCSGRGAGAEGGAAARGTCIRFVLKPQSRASMRRTAVHMTLREMHVMLPSVTKTITTICRPGTKQQWTHSWGERSTAF